MLIHFNIRKIFSIKYLVRESKKVKFDCMFETRRKLLEFNHNRNHSNEYHQNGQSLKINKRSRHESTTN